jgi:hypothetical protein
MQNFRTYQLAKELYLKSKEHLPLKGDARDQFLHTVTYRDTSSHGRLAEPMGADCLPVCLFARLPWIFMVVLLLRAGYIL